LRYVLRPLSPQGLELIRALERVVPVIATTDGQVDVYVSDYREIDEVLAMFSSNWSRLVELEAPVDSGPADRARETEAGGSASD
jgi:hypothetical protein